jgi:hypothetical protein
VIVGFEGSSTSERLPTRFSISLAVYREGEKIDSWPPSMSSKNTSPASVS